MVTSLLGNAYYASSVTVNNPGMYIITFMAIGSSSGSGTIGNLYMDGGISCSGAFIRSETSTYYCSGTIIQVITAGTYNLIVSYATSSVGLLTMSSGYLKFCRIA